MKQLPLLFFILMTIVCVGFIGIWFGQNISIQSESAHKNGAYMHAVLHDQLNVTEAQDKQLVAIEKEFQRLKMLYQGQMKIANMELAEVIKNTGYTSPEVQIIINKIHNAMGKLQTLSIEHLAQMQGVLNEEQNKKLKELVVEQLYKNANE